MNAIDIFESFKKNAPQYVKYVKLWIRHSAYSIVIILKDNSKYLYTANANGYWRFEEYKGGTPK